jgi:alpha-mannosidase
MNALRRYLICFSLTAAAFQVAAQSESASKPDLLKQPTLYVVGYAHLDTEWRWEYPQVIREFLPKTMHNNFNLFEKYPHYIFNFSGANRYRLMKEYYPADYATIKKYVDSGQWFLAGSSMEESDVNSPSAESILRQVLYGNHYFQKDFGHSSAEYMLPDCFGFPETLPSLLAHAGVKGFSTQKLTWGSAAPVGGPNSPEETPEGTPFNVGIWTGPDGNGVLAALNPGSYSGDIRYDLTKSPEEPKNAETGGRRRQPEVDWVKRIERDGKVSGLFADYHYYGTGDTGGSPDEESVKLVEAMVTKSKTVLPPPFRSRFAAQEPAVESTPVEVGNGPVKLISSTADQMFLDILATGKQDGLPKYAGDLELTNHSAGSLTSEAYQKRWNRKNELLADAAEKASVAAAWMGARPYPQQRLNDAWTLVMGGQFHDIMAGTATPKAYEFAWNDDVIAMNQFAAVLTNATEGVAQNLDTEAKAKATPLVVYNPLAIEREDVVEAHPVFGGKTPDAVRVISPDGKEVPAQMEDGKVLFVAKAPSAGYAVYDVQPARRQGKNSQLKVTENSLENARYKLSVDKNGDVASVFDKQLNKELLSAPLRLAFQTEKPEQWPAWNMDWADQQKPPRAYVSGPAQVRIVEKGPVRVALEITRETEGSKFVQTIRLSAGDAGNRVEFANSIDWKSSSAALKATFPLTASNPVATYNWDVATIERSNNDPKKFEVPSHQFIDLTDRSGAFGVTVLTDCKNGSDKPDDNLLRLTLIYTPGISKGGQGYSDQATQDWGHHEFMYGLAGHSGDWRAAQTDWQALRLNQPLIAFETSPHAGKLGKSFSIVKVDNSRVRVMALKKAEDGDDVILRLVEVDGNAPQGVHVQFPGPVASAKEVDGQEHLLGDAKVENGALITSFKPHQIRTFKIHLQAAPASNSELTSEPLTLTYDQSVATKDGATSNGGFDGQGNSLPAEMLPENVAYNGVQFKLGSTQAPNAETAKGQTINLPAGNFDRVYLLAASSGGDQTAAFKVGEQAVNLTVEDWGGFVGQWDDRTWVTKVVPRHWDPLPPQIKPDSPQAKAILKYQQEHSTREEMEYTGVKPGFIKRATIAWYASHRHDAKGENEPYSYSYLFAYELDVPHGAKTLTLPDNPRIRILAATAVAAASEVKPAQPLYDVLGQEAQAR